MDDRFKVNAQDFEMFLFEGTSMEVVPLVQAWRRPDGVTVHHVDIADVCSDAETSSDARQSLEAELTRLSRESGSSVVLIDGLHLMPTLFPDGPLQPILARLRSGGRVVVFVAPPSAGKALPDVAQLDEWRELIRTQLGSSREDRVIVGGGS
jgi:hypothetical protein